MDNQQETKKLVIEAVRKLAYSIRSNSSTVSDITTLVEITSLLKPSNFNFWERLIRQEFSSALEANPSLMWKTVLKRTRHLTWIDLTSWDGRKRERTLRTLTGTAPNNFFLILALRRLNDWVPQVRDAAREKLPQIIDASDPELVVNALFAILPHWNSWGRMSDSDKSVLLDTFSKESVKKALLNKIVTSNSGPMTSIFSQIGRTPALDANLKYISENAIQPSVRAKAFRSIFDGKMTCLEGRKFEWTDIRYCEGRLKPVISEREVLVHQPFLDTLRLASSDPSPMVKRIAADMLIQELQHIGEESLILANLFSSDKAPSVAERGRFALKKLNEIK